MIPYPRAYPLRGVKKLTPVDSRIDELTRMARDLKNKQVENDLKILAQIARGEA